MDLNWQTTCQNWKDPLLPALVRPVEMLIPLGLVVSNIVAGPSHGDVDISKSLDDDQDGETRRCMGEPSRLMQMLWNGKRKPRRDEPGAHIWASRVLHPGEGALIPHSLVGLPEQDGEYPLRQTTA